MLPNQPTHHLARDVDRAGASPPRYAQNARHLAHATEPARSCTRLHPKPPLKRPHAAPPPEVAPFCASNRHFAMAPALAQTPRLDSLRAAGRAPGSTGGLSVSVVQSRPPELPEVAVSCTENQPAIRSGTARHGPRRGFAGADSNPSRRPTHPSLS